MLFNKPLIIGCHGLQKSVIFFFLILFLSLNGFGQEKYLERRNIQEGGIRNFHIDVSNSNFQNESEMVSLIYE